MLRVSEIYPSFQGEGPNTGKPTLFVRFAGCNFKCAGWACDTPHAIDPKIFTKEQMHLSPEHLRTKCRLALPSGMRNICLTGGEPFLQNADDISEFLGMMQEDNLTVEAFTNGSLVWPSTAIDLIHNFIMDWKLPGSGEFPNEEVVLKNLSVLGAFDAVKFTVKHLDDLQHAKVIFNQYIADRPKSSRPVVWCGPVWGSITSAEVAGWILTSGLPWNLNTQVHKYLFGADTRRT